MNDEKLNLLTKDYSGESLRMLMQLALNDNNLKYRNFNFLHECTKIDEKENISDEKHNQIYNELYIEADIEKLDYLIDNFDNEQTIYFEDIDQQSEKVIEDVKEFIQESKISKEYQREIIGKLKKYSKYSIIAIPEEFEELANQIEESIEKEDE